MSARKVFLLVDDDPRQRELMKMEFQKPEIKAELHVVQDGVEAQQYIEGEGAYQDRQKYPFPEVILLDLNMPRMDGFEFLAWLRSRPDEAERCIPVMVMAGSTEPQTIARAYALGANGYLVKESRMGKLGAQVKGVISFWGRTAETKRNQCG